MLLVLGVGNGRRGAGLLYEEPGEGGGHAALGSVAGGRTVLGEKRRMLAGRGKPCARARSHGMECRLSSCAGW